MGSGTLISEESFFLWCVLAVPNSFQGKVVSGVQMSHWLNSIKGGYVGDYIGDYYKGY